MNPNTVAAIAALVRALLPVGAEIASLFIHNPESQHKLAVIVSDVTTISAVAQSVAQAPKA